MPLQAGRDDADPAAQTLFIHWRVAAERPGGIVTATIAAGGAGRAPRSVARSHRRRLIHIYFEVRPSARRHRQPGWREAKGIAANIAELPEFLGTRSK